VYGITENPYLVQKDIPTLLKMVLESSAPTAF